MGIVIPPKRPQTARPKPISGEIPTSYPPEELKVASVPPNTSTIEPKPSIFET